MAQYNARIAAAKSANGDKPLDTTSPLSKPTPTASTGTWSDPYMLGGSYVQKNSVSGEVRQAVNPPNAPATSSSKTVAQKNQDSKAQNWLMLQKGYSQSDLQKYNSDPVFRAWVISQSSA